MKHSRPDPTNLESLDRYWRRSSFHDESIKVIDAINKRVIIRLGKMTLVITGATDLKRCELPAVWLDQSIDSKGDGFVLDILTDQGPLCVRGRDVRLIRNCDLAMIIPPIDV